MINDHKSLEKEATAYQSIQSFKQVDETIVRRNYQMIKQDVQDIMESEMEAILNDPAKASLLIKK